MEHPPTQPRAWSPLHSGARWERVPPCQHRSLGRIHTLALCAGWPGDESAVSAEKKCGFSLIFFLIGFWLASSRPGCGGCGEHPAGPSFIPRDLTGRLQHLSSAGTGRCSRGAGDDRGWKAASGNRSHFISQAPARQLRFPPTCESVKWEKSLAGGHGNSLITCN